MHGGIEIQRRRTVAVEYFFISLKNTNTSWNNNILILISVKCLLSKWKLMSFSWTTDAQIAFNNYFLSTSRAVNLAVSNPRHSIALYNHACACLRSIKERSLLGTRYRKTGAIVCLSSLYNSNHTTITHFTVTILSEQRQFSFRRSLWEEIPGLVAIDRWSVISWNFRRSNRSCQTFFLLYGIKAVVTTNVTIYQL